VNHLTSSDASIVLAGAAGQGIETVAGMLATVVKEAGYHVFVTREFMSRIRGGTNSLQLRISSDRRVSYLRRTDIAVPLSVTAIPHLERYSRLSTDTLLIGEKEYLHNKRGSESGKSIEVPFSDIAKEIGGSIYTNTVASGVIAAIFEVTPNLVYEYLTKRFARKGEKIVQQNIEAYDRGHKIGSDIVKSEEVSFQIRKNPEIKHELILGGTDAIALGAIAGGCNFIASYPMSPSTGVLTFLAQQACKFGMVVDQTEDEISAINKGIGAWYAGGRAMVTTSGGGFALMTEGLSLAGMMESPMVIHLAQRPGPATGLPTRTAQGDLRHVINAGHGDFPRIVFAPGTLEEAFILTQQSFNVAAKFQVPVFVLTDQYFVDSSYNIPKLDLSAIENTSYISKTKQDYQRYRLTADGISPRGIPNNGQGTVVADSDEHDEDGHITENLITAPKMVEKRMRKFEKIRDDFINPRVIGPDNYKSLIISWGSNFHVVREALDELQSDDVASMHFSQVYPLPDIIRNPLERADEVLIVENNVTGQFADVILTETGFQIPQENKLLKYDGLPFAVEDVIEFIEGGSRQEVS